MSRMRISRGRIVDGLLLGGIGAANFYINGKYHQRKHGLSMKEYAKRPVSYVQPVALVGGLFLVEEGVKLLPR